MFLLSEWIINKLIPEIISVFFCVTDLNLLSETFGIDAVL